MLEALRDTVDNVLFAVRHSTTPDVADRARSVMLENQKLLDGMVELGMVTGERLEEIVQDKDLQDRYASLMKRAQDGGEAARQAFSELFLLEPDELCGWFEYYRSFYERRWGLKLISPED